MFHSIVVPLDGSLLGASILPYVPFLAAPGASVTLASVIKPQRELLPSQHARNAEQADRLRTLLQRDLESRAQQLRLAGLDVTTTVQTGEVATEILGCARVHDADLVAMATHGRPGIGGLAQRSVAYRVLHGATCPTFVLRPTQGYQTTATIDTIVVPLDGSAFAAQAVPVAQQLARRYSASIAVVEVVQDLYPTYMSDSDPGSVGLAIWEEANERSRAQAGEYVDVMTTRLREASLSAMGVIRDGMPAEALARFVARQPAPLIVTASHGRTGLSRWLLGSVAEELVMSVSCPLIILPAAAEERVSDTDRADVLAAAG